MGQIHHLKMLVALDALEGMQISSAGAFNTVVFTLLLANLKCNITKVDGKIGNDTVLIEENENNVQMLVNELKTVCKRQTMKVNVTKS